jgi:glycosyltransferase involved in cell wall biosynthesis
MRKAPPNLRFVPYCSGRQLAELFHDSDVFCLPSVWHDPFPLAPLEAMAAGLPVVATRSGGIPEALSDGGGILIERNSVDALSDALTELSRDPGLRERLSHEAFSSFIRNFRWEHVRAHYNSIIGGLHLA